MKMTNVSGTADLKCACESWLKHWEIFSGQTTSFCQEISCLNKDLVGAHVKVFGETTVHIYPLCNAHNQSTKELTVSDAYKPVLANPKLTCEKR